MTWFIFAAFTAVFIVLAALQFKLERQRRADFQRLADDLGMSFQPAADLADLVDLHDFPLFQHGHARRVSCLLRGRVDGADTLLCDYAYTTGHGKHRSTHRFSLAAFPVRGDCTPAFMLRPEGLLDKIGAALGWDDIDFPEHPDFSKRWRLTGPDAEAIRAFFLGGRAESLPSQTNIAVASDSRQLLIHAPRTGRGNVAAFFETARELRRALC